MIKLAAVSRCSLLYERIRDSSTLRSARRAACALAGCAVIFPSLLCLRPQNAPSTTTGFNNKWVLSWDDEFDGANGSPPDKKKWLVQTGGNGWGNSELEYYTARPENIRQENGDLVIEAIREKFTGPDNVSRNYTSGRVNTSGRFAQTYGRFEARIKNPSGRGVWPAFWLLGNDFSKVGWPACGEIDIMEEIGPRGSEIRGSLHGPGYSGRNSLTTTYRLPSGDFGDAFHVFALEWEPGVLRFYVDGHLYATKTPSDLPAGKNWVYDHPFFLVLNLAVRGDISKSADPSTVFPQRMLVDYVRVYKRR
jgi:beta-glucanase (GH16 family)